MILSLQKISEFPIFPDKWTGGFLAIKETEWFDKGSKR